MERADSGQRDPAVDATRRTRLANERTELAWWRTGMTALALALAVGRVVPELAESSRRWPYAVAGVCFALYGAAMMIYGSYRRRAVEQALDRGEFPRPLGLTRSLLVAGGALVSVIAVVLVVID